MAEFPDDQLIPISALQHLLFCERQCALIHVERQWAESRSTVEGKQLHRKAHRDRGAWQDGVYIARGLRLQSQSLGLWGQADVVEFRTPTGQSPSTQAGRVADPTRLIGAGELSHWLVTPVEYKRGRPKQNDCDRVQLCAQALCLEEMLGVSIERGSLFYGKLRRRVEVAFEASLRAKTLTAVARLRELVASGVTPRAVREKKCDACSLLEICLPDAMVKASARRYLDGELTKSVAADGPATDRFDFLGTVP